MVDNFVPAEFFHPREYIQQECAARGWTAKDLAFAAQSTIHWATEKLTSDRRLTLLDCHCLALAFGVNEQTWVNLQAMYDKKPETS